MSKQALVVVVFPDVLPYITSLLMTNAWQAGSFIFSWCLARGGVGFSRMLVSSH